MKNKIVFEEWEKNCEEGSCYEYGTRLIVNGKVLLNEMSAKKAIVAVLKELGVEFEIEERFKEE